MKYILAILILLSGLVMAQSTATIGVLPDMGPALPATCSVGQIYFKTTTTVGLNQCTASNTWSAVGSGSGLPTGCSGAAGVITCTAFTTSSSNGGITGTEGDGSALTAGAGVDLLFPQATAHQWVKNVNGGGNLFVPGIATAGTSGNLSKLAANGIDITDSSIPTTCTSCVMTIPTGFPPFAINTAGANLVVAQNEMDCVDFTPHFTQTFSKLTYRPTTSAGAGSHVGFAIYSQDGNTRIATTGALDGTLTAAQSVTFAGTIIQNKSYAFCWTDDAATSTTWAAYSFNSPIAQITGLYNTSGNAHFFHGANASVAGAPPATLGARTANTTGNPANTPIGVLD